MAEIKFIILILLLFIETLQKSDVYFTKIVSSQKIIDMFEKLNIELTGNIGLKVHTGEREGPYFLKPSFLKDIIFMIILEVLSLNVIPLIFLVKDILQNYMKKL